MPRRVWGGVKRGMKMLIINHICDSPFQTRKNITDERSKYSLCFTAFQKNIMLFFRFACLQCLAVTRQDYLL